MAFTSGGLMVTRVSKPARPKTKLWVTFILIVDSRKIKEWGTYFTNCSFTLKILILPEVSVIAWCSSLNRNQPWNSGIGERYGRT